MNIRAPRPAQQTHLWHVGYMLGMLFIINFSVAHIRDTHLTCVLHPNTSQDTLGTILVIDIHFIRLFYTKFQQFFSRVSELLLFFVTLIR